MIKTLSPYYVDVPLTNPTTLVVCESFVIKLYVWDGNKTAVPAEATYESTIINATASNGEHRVNIARLINSEIDFNITPSLVTNLENSDNQVWAKFEVYYDDQPELAQGVFTELCVKGYGYFKDGENPNTPTNKNLLNINEYKVNRGGMFVMGIELTQPTPVAPVLTIDDIVNIDIDTYTVTFSTNIDFSVVNLRFSVSGDDDWTILEPPHTSSPFDILLPIFVPHDIQLFAYDPLTNTDVYSNIFLLIP